MDSDEVDLAAWALDQERLKPLKPLPRQTGVSDGGGT